MYDACISMYIQYKYIYKYTWIYIRRIYVYIYTLPTMTHYFVMHVDVTVAPLPQELHPGPLVNGLRIRN